MALQNIACLYRDSGRFVESRELFDQVIAIQEAEWGPGHPWSVENSRDYLDLLRLMGQDEEAAVVESRNQAIVD